MSPAFAGVASWRRRAPTASRRQRRAHARAPRDHRGRHRRHQPHRRPRHDASARCSARSSSARSSNGMNLMGVNSNWQLIFTGLILLGASLLDALSSKKDVTRMRTSRVALAVVARCAVGFGRRRRVAAADGGRDTRRRRGTAKVAFLLSTLQEERYQKDQRYFEDAGEGARPRAVHARGRQRQRASSSRRSRTRSRAAPRCSSSSRPTAPPRPRYVAKAHAKGAKVVAYDRAIPSDALDFYVAHDSSPVGVLQAEAAVEGDRRQGQLRAPRRPVRPPRRDRDHARLHERARAATSTSGDIKIVVEKNHDAWSPEQALQDRRGRASRRPKGDIHAILANNSGMARGAVQAIARRRPRRKKIFIAGADADAANVNYVCEGKQTIEVLKDIKPLAEKAAEVAAALAAASRSRHHAARCRWPRRRRTSSRKRTRRRCSSTAASTPRTPFRRASEATSSAASLARLRSLLVCARACRRPRRHAGAPRARSAPARPPTADAARLTPAPPPTTPGSARASRPGSHERRRAARRRRRDSASRAASSCRATPRTSIPRCRRRTASCSAFRIDDKRGLTLRVARLLPRADAHHEGRAPRAARSPNEGEYNCRTPVPRRRRLLPLGLRLHAGQRDGLGRALPLRRQRQGHGDDAAPGHALLGRGAADHRSPARHLAGLAHLPHEARLRAVLHEVRLRVKARRLLGALRPPAEVRHVHLLAHPPDGRERPPRVREGQVTFWLQHGVGTHLEDIAANQGLTLLNYASAGASYARTFEVGGYFFDSNAQRQAPAQGAHRREHVDRRRSTSAPTRTTRAASTARRATSRRSRRTISLPRSR